MQSNYLNLSRQEQDAAILKDVADNGTFAEYCIAIDPRYSMQWFHREIADKLEDGYRRLKQGKSVRLMIFMPLEMVRATRPPRNSLVGYLAKTLACR